MPSIVIGGENTDIGLHYLDELSRQRQYQLQLASMQQSSSGASRPRQQQEQTQPQQEAPQQENGGGAGGMPADYNERIKFMQQMFASSSNKQNQQRMQELQSNINNYDASLKTMSPALAQAQDPDQVETMMGSIRDLTKKKNDDTNEYRRLQSQPQLTGNANVDALQTAVYSQTRAGQQVGADASADPYEALGKFYGQGAKTKADAKLKQEQQVEDYKKAILLDRGNTENIDQLNRTIQERMTNLTHMNPEDQEDAFNSISDTADKLDKLMQDRSKTTGAEFISSKNDLMAAASTAARQGQEAYHQKQIAQQAAEHGRATTAAKEKADQEDHLRKEQENWVALRGKDATKMSAENADTYIENEAAQFEKDTGFHISEEKKMLAKAENPTWAHIHNYAQSAEQYYREHGGNPSVAIMYLQQSLKTLQSPVQEADKAGAPIPTKLGEQPRMTTVLEQLAYHHSLVPDQVLDGIHKLIDKYQSMATAQAQRQAAEQRGQAMMQQQGGQQYRPQLQTQQQVQGDQRHQQYLQDMQNNYTQQQGGKNIPNYVPKYDRWGGQGVND